MLFLYTGLRLRGGRLLMISIEYADLCICITHMHEDLLKIWREKIAKECSEQVKKI
jgi:hypothetical protein